MNLFLLTSVTDFSKSKGVWVFITTLIVLTTIDIVIRVKTSKPKLNVIKKDKEENKVGREQDISIQK